MYSAHDAIFLTGATGLVGTHVLRRLLEDDPDLHAFVLVRDVRAWRTHALAEGLPARRIVPVRGDVTRPGLGLERSVRSGLAHRIGLVVHSAADTTFSRPVEEARVVNARGTEHVLEIAEAWPGVARFVQVSTAYVAGRLRGRIPERRLDGRAGFVNGYEQSKHEAEAVVREARIPWVIVRPGSIVCDGAHGGVSQVNAVHRALRLYHNGLASMMPGEEANRVDVVSADWVAECLVRLATAEGVEGGTYHACSGDRALTLGGLLDTAYAVWAECPRWRRRGIARPALTDLNTYHLFEDAVEETGDERLRAITRSLSHFVPQLALPKVFDTRRMDHVVGRPPPDPARFWAPMLRHLIDSRWVAETRRVA